MKRLGVLRRVLVVTLILLLALPSLAFGAGPAALGVGVVGTAAVLDIPANAVIFGSKAYDISLLNSASLSNQILAAFVAAGNTFIWLGFDGLYTDPYGAAVSASRLPAALDYMAADGTSRPDRTQVAATVHRVAWRLLLSRWQPRRTV